MITAKFYRLTVAAIASAMIAGCGSGSAPRDPKAAADQFFALLSADKAVEAYNAAAFGMRVQQTQKKFEATVRDYGLTDWVSSEWKSAEKDEKKQQIVLEGVVKTKSHGEIPVSVSVVEEEGRWKVYTVRLLWVDPSRGEMRVAVRFSGVGQGISFGDDLARQLPPLKELKAMATESLLAFNKGIEEETFDSFYKYISDRWQSQVSQTRLYRAFKVFVDRGVDLSSVTGVDPEFDVPPSINSEGLLSMTGFFRTEPLIRFNLKYIYELPNWKLFAIEVSVEPKEEKTAE